MNQTEAILTQPFASKGSFFVFFVAKNSSICPSNNPPIHFLKSATQSDSVRVNTIVLWQFHQTLAAIARIDRRKVPRCAPPNAKAASGESIGATRIEAANKNALAALATLANMAASQKQGVFRRRRSLRSSRGVLRSGRPNRSCARL
jgi:hypothetical protein